MRHSLSGDIRIESVGRSDPLFARLSFGELAYRQAGRAGQPALVLIHGWGGASRYWLTVMHALSDDFCCYAPDLPGFGLSPPMRRRDRGQAGRSAASSDDDSQVHHSHRGLAEVVAAFMDAMNIERCDVIGHSYGSGVAIALAAQHPARVRRLIISNFSTFRDERERRFIEFMHKIAGLMVKARKLPFANSDGFARLLGGRYFHQLPVDAQVLREGLDDFLRMDEATADSTMKASLGWETPNDLARVQAPMLLIHCRNDQIMPPQNAEYTARLAPRGRIAWIEQCGHLPMVERPDEFVRLVRTFLQDEHRFDLPVRADDGAV